LNEPLPIIILSPTQYSDEIDILNVNQPLLIIKKDNIFDEDVVTDVKGIVDVGDGCLINTNINCLPCSIHQMPLADEGVRPTSGSNQSKDQNKK
jgi:hypothetical protein